MVGKNIKNLRKLCINADQVFMILKCEDFKGAVIKYLQGGAGGNFQIFENISVAPPTHQKKFQDPPVNWLKFS